MTTGPSAAARPATATVLTLAILAAVLAACGAASTSSPSASAEPPASRSAGPTPTPDPAALAAYTDAMCPIFGALLALDPRLTEIREVAADGGDLEAEVDEMTALAEEQLAILNDLEAVPDWAPGAPLRYQLITSLHEIRATLLGVIRDPDARDAADDIATMPYLSSNALDLAMTIATDAGLECESTT